MSSSRTTVRPGGTAIYLRCYPADLWEMALHRHALENLAQRTGLSDPRVYLDNGIPSGSDGPRLRQLLDAVDAGHVGTVLVPGAWVFALCPRAAGATCDRIRATGARLIEMPSPRAVPGNRTAVKGTRFPDGRRVPGAA